MSLVGDAFAAAAEQGRAAVIGYLPAGYPSVAARSRPRRAMAEGGADMIELGLPYSDPLIDGPVIQEAVYRALQAGTGWPTCCARWRRWPPPARRCW